MFEATKGLGSYRRLLAAVQPYRPIFLGSLLGMVALASTEWVLPALLRHLVDDEFGKDLGRYFLLLPVVLIVLFFTRGLMSYVANVGLNALANRVVMDLRAAMFRTLVALPTRFFDQRTAGEVISKFTFDVTQMTQAATNCLTVLVKDSFIIVALIAYLVYINGRLAVFLLLVAPPTAWIISKVSRRMRQLSHRLQGSMGAINAVIEEAIGGHRDIKIFGGQDYEIGRFERAINAARKFTMKVVSTNAATEPLVQACIALGVGLMVMLALREAARGSITRGDFVSFVTATAMLLPPIKRLTNMNENLQRGLAAADSVFALIDEPIERTEGKAPLAAIRGALEFRGVHAGYRDSPVLSEINLSINAGEAIAFVGPSGGGKTSLVNLIPRFYEPTEGEILLDGQPIAACDLRALRAQIAYVGQHVVLFNDTIYHNIAYGALRALPHAQVLAAADAAFVTEFVAPLPQGFDTEIGDKGLRLSGGQRQRLALARAILKDAPILILDEATSALDAESERRVQDALTKLRPGRTCLIIAHRLATIEGVDRVVVIEDGRILEQGTHGALLKRGGLYAKLHALQYESAERADF